MGRSTFDGPILSGDNKFPPFRNVGYTDLAQFCDIDLSNNVNGTAQNSGTSGAFVNGNLLGSSTGPSNLNASVFVPSATAFPSALQTIPADTSTNVYRGAVMYVPAGVTLHDFFVDLGVVVGVAGGSASLTSATVYVSNNYTVAAGTPTYFATGAITAVGRQAAATFTATQIANQAQTTTDILQPNGYPNLSQIVFTVAIVGTALDTRTALTGKLYFTLRYAQLDYNMGNLTNYPYGNFD